MKYLIISIVIISSLTSYAQEEKFSPGPDTVKIGAYVISVHNINFHDKEYTVRFWLWFLHDQPDFDFSKQLDIPNAKNIDFEAPIIDSIGDKAWIIMKMKCIMKENWNVADFPFDKQTLSVQIENTLFDKSSLVFVADTAGSRFDDEEAIDGWTISDFHVSTTTNDYHTGFGDSRPGKDSSEFSQFLIKMKIERNALGLFMKIFVGMYIAFLISIISFTPQPSELEPRFGLPVGGLFAAVGNKYIIDSLLPESSTFTLVDTLHTLTFLGIFATLVISAVTLKLVDYKKDALAKKVNRIGSFAVIGLYIVLNIVFIAAAVSNGGN
jgi:hypothetical protein